MAKITGEGYGLDIFKSVESPTRWIGIGLVHVNGTERAIPVRIRVEANQSGGYIGYANFYEPPFPEIEVERVRKTEEEAAKASAQGLLFQLKKLRWLDSHPFVATDKPHPD